MAVLLLLLLGPAGWAQTLGTSTQVVGAAAGSDSVVLALPTPTNAWTATANDA